MGPVNPLLAVKAEVERKNPDSKFLFIGPKNDTLFKKIVEKRHIPYKEIWAGKWHRYFTFQNIFSPFFVFFGFLASLKIIQQFKPNIVFAAGSFTAVPVGIAAWLLRIPLFIHQQDIIPSLTNRILSPLAYKITVSLPPSLKDFPSKKTVLTGNPVREEILKPCLENQKKFFSLQSNLPVILVLGGGQGAVSLNNLIYSLIPQLTKISQIIHLTGKGKSLVLKYENYHQFEFLDKEMPLAYKAADIVICRAGMGTLSELSLLGKPAIVFPIPYTHQEANAYYFQKKKAVKTLFRSEQNKERLFQEIKNLFQNYSLRQELISNIKKINSPLAAKKISLLFQNRGLSPSTDR